MCAMSVVWVWTQLAQRWLCRIHIWFWPAPQPVLYPGELWEDNLSFSLMFQVERPCSGEKKQRGKEIPRKGNVATHSESWREQQKGDQDLERLYVMESTRCFLARRFFVRIASCTSPRPTVNAFGQRQDSPVSSGFSTLLDIVSKYFFPCKIVARLVLFFFFPNLSRSCV